MSKTHDHGEPWSKKEHSWAESSLYSHGGKKLLFTHSIDDGDTTEDNQQEREDEQSRLLNRIASCVSACAGIPDPESALTAVREALEAEELWRNQRDDTGTLRAIAKEKRLKALNLLTPAP